MNLVIKDWSTKDILSLCFIKELRNKNIPFIINQFSSLEEFLEARKTEYFPEPLQFNPPNKIFLELAEKQIELCEKNNYKIITLWDSSYPAMLKQIAYPPIVLFVQGTLQAPDSIVIAIVGTRRATTYGKLTAEKFSQCFVKHNTIVCSGLANGIDTYAHLTALKNNGITYAVIGSGLDCISPYFLKQNAEKILSGGGAIISEYPCGTKAKPAYFPQRNRIIAGISIATVIIEAGEKSGALITANFAFNENRELFAVPGNINSEKSKGTNTLIQTSKARIATSPEQVLTELGVITDKIIPQEKIIKFSSASEEKIYNLLNSEPTNVDKLIELSKMETSELLVILLNLEFRGLIRQLPGKNYIKEF